MPRQGLRTFQDDFDQALNALLEDGTIQAFSSDLGGLGSVFNIHVTVTVSGLQSPVEVALVRDKVRQAVGHLTDNVMISVERAPTEGTEPDLSGANRPGHVRPG
jgi:hypothetical protein